MPRCGVGGRLAAAAAACCCLLAGATGAVHLYGPEYRSVHGWYFSRQPAPFWYGDFQVQEQGDAYLRVPLLSQYACFHVPCVDVNRGDDVGHPSPHGQSRFDVFYTYRFRSDAPPGTALSCPLGGVRARVLAFDEGFVFGPPGPLAGGAGGSFVVPASAGTADVQYNIPVPGSGIFPDSGAPAFSPDTPCGNATSGPADAGQYRCGDSIYTQLSTGPSVPWRTAVHRDLVLYPETRLLCVVFEFAGPGGGYVELDSVFLETKHFPEASGQLPDTGAFFQELSARLKSDAELLEFSMVRENRWLGIVYLASLILSALAAFAFCYTFSRPPPPRPTTYAHDSGSMYVRESRRGTDAGASGNGNGVAPSSFYLTKLAASTPPSTGGGTLESSFYKKTPAQDRQGRSRYRSGSEQTRTNDGSDGVFPTDADGGFGGVNPLGTPPSPSAVAGGSGGGMYGRAPLNRLKTSRYGRAPLNRDIADGSPDAPAPAPPRRQQGGPLDPDQLYFSLDATRPEPAPGVGVGRGAPYMYVPPGGVPNGLPFDHRRRHPAATVPGFRSRRPVRDDGSTYDEIPLPDTDPTDASPYGVIDPNAPPKLSAGSTTLPPPVQGGVYNVPPPLAGGDT